MKSVRQERINSEIKKTLAYIIDNELRDTQIDAMVSVTEVEITPDLAEAKVFISSIGKTPKEEVLARIKGAGGFLRRELSKKIKLRVTPRLNFFLDNSMEYSNKIESILKNITYTTKPDDDFEGSGNEK